MAEEVGNLGVKLSLDSSDFNRPLASVERNIKALSGELSAIRSKGDEWSKSIEGLKTRQEVLGRTLSTQETKVKKLRDAYDRAAEKQGVNALATEKLAVQLNKAVAEYTRTETELKNVNNAIKSQTSLWNQLEQKLDRASNTLNNTSEKMKSAGQGLTVGLTVPILGASAAALKMADTFDSAQGRIQAQLGLTKEESEKLSGVAKSLWKDAYGENVTEVGNDLVTIKQYMEDLSDVELQGVAEGAYAIRDAFGSEIADTTRTASVLMKNFEIDGTTALDLITTSFQRGGDFSGELLDTLREYAPQFKGMGYNAEEFTAILIAGAKAGAFNLDKVGDAAKEAFLRIGDGSKTSRDALGSVGLDFKQIENDINSGGETAKTAFAAVASAIAGIQDPAKRAQTAVALLGTPIEDLGPEFQAFFADVNLELGNFEGSTKAAGEALYNNFGTRATSVFRDFQEDLLPAGEILLELAEEWLPKVAEKASELTEAFADLSPEAQENAVAIAGVAAAAGPLLLGVSVLTSGIGGLIQVAKPLIKLMGTAGLASSIGALVNPIGLAVAGVGLLTVGVIAGVDAYKEANEINLEVLETKQKEIDKNDKLIESFDELRSKNALSNEQMLRYLDIQAELESTNAPERVAALKDEQAKLLDKSTLTNDQMDEFLGLNQKVIDTAPSTVKAISSQGVAFAENTGALKELNAEKAKELENDARKTLKNALEQEANLLKEKTQYLEEINLKNEEQRVTKEKISSLDAQITEHEANILDLQNQKSEADASELIDLENKIKSEQAIVAEKKNQLLEADELITTYGEQIDERNLLLETNRKEIALAEEAKFKYEEIILAQAGITSKKGQGLIKIDEEINKLQIVKRKLSEQLATGEINTAEYQNQNSKIDAQISKLQTAQGELRLINKTAEKTVFKDVIIRPYPERFWDTLDANLSRSVSKSVNIRYNNVNGPQEPGYAVGTPAQGHPGGPAIVGDGVGNNAGRELIKLPNQKLFLSPAKPTLLNLPKGTSVLSAINTRKYLGHVPKYATGTKNTTTSTPFELVNYDSRLKAVGDGSNVARIREIRNAEIASLETKIELLTKEGATIQQLNQAKEMETRLTKLQSDKAREYQNRIKEQKITVEVLNKAYKNKKITLSEYNSEVAKAQSEIHKLTAEQMAFNNALSKRQDLADSMREDTNSQMQAYEKGKVAQLKQLSDRNDKSEDLFKQETSMYIDELNRQKDAALNSFDAQTKAHEASVNRQIENLKKKRDAEIGAIDAQLAALEELEKVESREEIEAGFGTEKENLNRRLTIASFMGDEDTVKSVNSEIATLDKEIAKQRINWQREDTRDALSLEKERIDQAYDLQEKELENSLVLWKAERDRERENLEAHYELRAEQFALMREQQLENLELQHENNLVAAEREFEFQKERFTALQEQLALHLENGTITQAQANAAWLQAMKDAGAEQVFQEIENQEKSKVALDGYVTAYLDMGKKYGNNLINGVIGTLNTRLSEVTAAAAKIRSAMSIDTSSTMQSAAFNTRAITQATPVTSIAPQLIHINMDGEEIASYALSHATGALRQISRKG